ncbi:MAG TPA: hypothetical protein VFA25_00025 [Actinomycetota bacterium]|nr:hypothetical protein [Actinomycetota bacterium]
MDVGDGGRLAILARRRAPPWTGPLLIVLAVLFALRGFVVDGALTNQHPDLLTFWLPRWSFLGRTLAAGDLPIRNPFEMAGFRFAADPQSGWLYAPVMALFSIFPPGLALRLFIALNPLLAGLALFAFLRKESFGGAAATMGGLVLAMPIATSMIAISLPFAGALAWTAVLLLAAAGFRRAHARSGRSAWLALGAFAWSQVAAAHLSHGLVIATVFVVAYLAAGAVADARAGDVSGRAAAARMVLFLAVLPIAALPILLPHADFLSASSLRGGYGALGDPGETAVGDALGSMGVWPAWPLGFAAAPGAYAGAAALACAPLSFRARRQRAAVLAAAGPAVAAYVLTWPVLVTAGWFRAIVLKIPFGDVYLHNPGRLRYVAVLAIPILAAAGLQGLIDRPLPWRMAIVWVVGAFASFFLWPVVAGGTAVRFLLVAMALILVGPVLASFASGRRAWATAPVVVGLLSVELLVSAVYSQIYEGGTIFTGLEGREHPILVPQVLRFPELDEDAYLRVTPIVRHLRRRPGRFATWAPPEAFFEKGYLWMRSPADWPALAPARGTLFGVEDALGYNPVQLPRYWRFIRTTNELSVFYNASVLNEPTPEDVRLLGLRYLVVPTGIMPPLGGRIVEAADGYSLWQLDDAEPFATSSGRAVSFATNAGEALRMATAPGFDPARITVAEGPVNVTSPADVRAVAGRTDERSATEIRVRLEPEAAGVLTIRDAFDPGWRATADGRPATTLPVDGFLLGVLLPTATHVVVLTYHDEAVIQGLAVGAVVWSALLVAPFVALAIERRRGPRHAARRDRA